MYIGERDIGETIRILRTERGISREELAERVGISRSHLNKIEADIKRPSIITYQKIMDVLDADISINDEATANVAPENEADLMNAVEELTKEKTIIMIAHRLKTVRKADQILVIEKGRIAEQGTHDVLLQKNGIYSSFICSRKEAVTVKPLTFRMEKSANYPYHLLRMIYSFYIYAGTASFGGSHPNAFNFFKYAWIFRSALN